MPNRRNFQKGKNPDSRKKEIVLKSENSRFSELGFPILGIENLVRVCVCVCVCVRARTHEGSRKFLDIF